MNTGDIKIKEFYFISLKMKMNPTRIANHNKCSFLPVASELERKYLILNIWQLSSENIYIFSDNASRAHILVVDIYTYGKT